MSKDPVDQYDRDVREGMAILQLIVMTRAPSAIEGSWSPLLRKVAACNEVAAAIADFLLSHLGKREYQEELRGLLIEHVAHITPSTVWLLSHE